MLIFIFTKIFKIFTHIFLRFLLRLDTKIFTKILLRFLLRFCSDFHSDSTLLGNVVLTKRHGFDDGDMLEDVEGAAAGDGKVEQKRTTFQRTSTTLSV